MMKSKDILYDFLLASFAILVPYPGRFGFGIILVLLLNVQMLSLAPFKILVKYIGLESMMSVLAALLLVTESLIFKQILTLYSPLSALTLSFCIYLSAVCSFVISKLKPFVFSDVSLKVALAKETKANMKVSMLFSLFSLFVFLIRDILGYGTITFPTRNGLSSIVVHHGSFVNANSGVLLATVPGAVMVVSGLILLIWNIRNNLNIAGGIVNADAQ